MGGEERRGEVREWEVREWEERGWEEGRGEEKRRGGTVLFYETEQKNSLFFLHLLHTTEQLCNISIQVHKRSEVENGFFHHSSTSHNLCSSIHPLRKEQPGDAAEGAQPQTVQLQGVLDAPGET